MNELESIEKCWLLLFLAHYRGSGMRMKGILTYKIDQQQARDEMKNQEVIELQSQYVHYFCFSSILLSQFQLGIESNARRGKCATNRLCESSRVLMAD